MFTEKTNIINGIQYTVYIGRAIACLNRPSTAICRIAEKGNSAVIQLQISSPRFKGSIQTTQALSFFDSQHVIEPFHGLGIDLSPFLDEDNIRHELDHALADTKLTQWGGKFTARGAIITSPASKVIKECSISYVPFGSRTPNEMIAILSAPEHPSNYDITRLNFIRAKLINSH